MGIKKGTENMDEEAIGDGNKIRGGEGDRKTQNNG